MARLDLEQLLDPISADSPAGEDLEYDPLFGEMERAAEGKEEQQFGDTIIPAEEPDWRLVRDKAGKVLAQSKDLRAAMLLTKALVQLEGYPGLSDGLALIQGFITNYWESVHPQLDPDDDNDPTLRINTLINLCDPIQFLKSINKIPLVSSNVLGTFSLRDIQIAEGVLVPTGDDEKKSLDHIDGAFRECSPEDARTLLEQIRNAVACTAKIESELNQRVGIDQSPSLQALSDLLLQAEREVVTRSGGNLAEEMMEENGTSAPEALSQNTESVTSGGAIRSRDDVIQTLEKLCLYYEQNEPSSPVPLLLKRAKRLVKKDFFDIVQDLAPDGSTHFEFLWKQEEST